MRWRFSNSGKAIPSSNNKKISGTCNHARSFISTRPFTSSNIACVLRIWANVLRMNAGHAQCKLVYICSLNRFKSKHVPVTCFNSWSNYVRWRIILYYAPLTVRRHPVRSCNGDKSRRRNYGWIWRAPRSR